MYKIALENLEFYGHHGLYPKENLIGNTFVVDMFASLSDEHFQAGNLDSGLSYELAYLAIKEIMLEPEALLETLAKKIHDRMYQLQPLLQQVEVLIRKKQVPIDGFIGMASVSYTKSA